MAFAIRAGNLSGFERGLRDLAGRYDRAARLIAIESAALVESRAKRNFVGAHAPGQPHVGGDRPNVVTGMLRRSITHSPVQRVGIATYGTVVGPTTIYARRVELGYPGGSGRGRQRTRAFPYFGPAVKDSRQGMREIATRRWSQV